MINIDLMIFFLISIIITSSDSVDNLALEFHEPVICRYLQMFLHFKSNVDYSVTIGQRR